VNLVRSGQLPGYDIDSLRSRLTELEDALRARAEELARAKSGLDTFRIRYRQEVGSLHEELDELQRAIAEAEQAERAAHRDGETRGPATPAHRPETQPLPRFTSDAVRRLFRDVAKTIHPDFARDETARHRRHALMVEANRAYALGDEERLRWVLDAWENSPEAVQGSDTEAIRERLIRRIGQIEDQLSAHAADCEAMQDTPLWKLKAMVDEASARGKDLVGEMVARLKRDILVARNRLDAIQWRP
jgi:hypothetical protein